MLTFSFFFIFFSLVFYITFPALTVAEDNNIATSYVLFSLSPVDSADIVESSLALGFGSGPTFETSAKFLILLLFPPPLIAADLSFIFIAFLFLSHFDVNFSLVSLSSSVPPASHEIHTHLLLIWLSGVAHFQCTMIPNFLHSTSGTSSCSFQRQDYQHNIFHNDI